MPRRAKPPTHINWGRLAADMVEHRHALEESQAVMGERMDLSQDTISRIERGHRCSADVFVHVVAYLNRPLSRYLKEA